MITSPLYEERRSGLTLQIYIDDDPINPRQDFENFGHMVCWHRRYSLGDAHNFVNPFEFEIWLAGLQSDLEPTSARIAAAMERKAVILPLYLYDHSGITMNTTGFTCPWDSGRVGYVYATVDEIRTEFGVKRVSKALRTKVADQLRSAVSVYDDYLTGQVFGYEIRNDDNDVLDSCWGFFGETYCIDEARASLTRALS